MDKTDRLRDYGLAFLLYEQSLGICGYELIRELFIFIKLILNSYLTDKIEYMYFTGLIIAVSTFLIIGVFHPVVIKCEYYFGTRLWWVFLLLGLAFIVAALFISNVLASVLCGVTGASCLWSIGEIFEQKQRVKKGWFPMNPKRKADYED